MKHAAFIFSGGALVAFSTNTPTRHAEVAALAKASNLGRRPVLLSIRVDRLGKLRIAKPCPSCMAVIEKSKVRTLMWSTDDGLIERMRV